MLRMLFMFSALILKIMHDLKKLQCQNCQGLGYSGSCRIFSIQRSAPGLLPGAEGAQLLLAVGATAMAVGLVVKRQAA